MDKEQVKRAVLIGILVVVVIGVPFGLERAGQALLMFTVGLAGGIAFQLYKKGVL